MAFSISFTDKWGSAMRQGPLASVVETGIVTYQTIGEKMNRSGQW